MFKGQAVFIQWLSRNPAKNNQIRSISECNKSQKHLRCRIQLRISTAPSLYSLTQLKTMGVILSEQVWSKYRFPLRGSAMICIVLT